MAAFVLIDRGIAASLVPEILHRARIAFAAAITIVTEGPTSPSWVFFVFAMIMVDRRASLPAAITVTICSSLVYFMLLAAFVPGPRNEYLMRSAYLAIICYLIGFIGAQRDRFRSARAQSYGGDDPTPCNRAYPTTTTLATCWRGGEPSAGPARP